MYEWNNQQDNQPINRCGEYDPNRFVPAGNLEQEPVSAKGKKVGGGKGSGVVAMLLVVSLISGAAGGGTSYYLLTQNQDTALNAESEPAPAAEEYTAATAGTAGGGTATIRTTTDISSIAAKATVSVVEISVQSTAYNPFFGETESSSSGSGVILSEDGYIVTNNHVVEEEGTITVSTYDGDEYEAVLVGTDAQTDLAVIKIEAQGLTAVTFADSDKIQVGDTAVAIGNSLGTLGGTVTDGIVSAKSRELTIDNQTMTLIQTSAAVNPGNSGGGLFNADGNLIGVVNAKSSGSSVEGLGFAIPSNTVNDVAQDIINNGYVTGRAELGISIITVSSEREMLQYRVNAPGLYVASAVEGSGWQVGDRIIRIEGTEIESADDIKEILDESQVGDTLQVVVSREGATTEISVTMQEKVPDYVKEQQVQTSEM